MKKTKTLNIIPVVIAVVLSLSCSSGGAGSNADLDLIREAVRLYGFGVELANIDDAYQDLNTSFIGTVTNAEIQAASPDFTSATGSIAFSNSYSNYESIDTFALTWTFTDFCIDPSAYSSSLSGPLTYSRVYSVSNPTSTTGTLSYDGDDMVFDLYTDASGNLGGGITFRGTFCAAEDI